ncbi:MAG: hypothetical protein KME20_06630 [Kaiparowitsia implicata GSE-PSE-MK54-09C]|jgi:hypothetical protein|nr:hypothetical protein [Kaiparowitsia implicata GSE-PSE-MK54-09C]
MSIPDFMYTYTAYNLIIQSEIELPELIPSDGLGDITIRMGNLMRPNHRRSDGGNHFLGKVDGAGVFRVLDGCDITIQPEPGVDEAVLRPLIEGPILSTLLRQRGLLVLHAGSFIAQQGAIAFMADSGWGKSTLIETFHGRGYEILTDDVMALNLETGQPLVHPGIPQVKLCFDAAEYTGHAQNSLPLIHSHALKLSHRLTDGFSSRAVPLRRLYVLDYGDRNEIIPLTQQEAFLALVHHSRSMILLTAPEFQAAHLHQCSRLLQSVPVGRLVRRRSLANMPQVVAMIEADIEQAPYETIPPHPVPSDNALANA